MMQEFDVIIVGGGPAGLHCARELSGSSLRILLLEKQEGFGDKLCAGGLTTKALDVLPLPDQGAGMLVLSHRSPPFLRLTEGYSEPTSEACWMGHQWR